MARNKILEELLGGSEALAPQLPGVDQGGEFAGLEEDLRPTVPTIAPRPLPEEIKNYYTPKRPAEVPVEDDTADPTLVKGIGEAGTRAGAAIAGTQADIGMFKKDKNAIKIPDALKKIKEAKLSTMERLRGYTIDETGRKVRDKKKDIFKVTEMNKSYEKFSDKINDPTSRRILGRYQMQIDSADGIDALLSGYLSSDPRLKGYPTIESLNKMPPQQVEEVVKSLDRMLSQAAPTIEGMRELRPTSYYQSFVKFKQNLTNNPQEAKLGKFIAKYKDAINRERKVYTAKKETRLKGMSAAYDHLKQWDEDRFNKVVNGTLDNQVTNMYFGGDDSRRIGEILPEAELLKTMDKTKPAKPKKTKPVDEMSDEEVKKAFEAKFGGK